MKPYTPSIDYDKVHKLVNRDTAIKYNYRIAGEKDLQNKEAIKNELCDLFLTCFTQKLDDQHYPKMQSKKWQTMIGIKPGTKTPIGAFRDILITMYRDILEAKRKGTLENTHIAETVKYLFARHTAHKYGHDKRGTPETIYSAEVAGLIHKVHKPSHTYEQTPDDDICDAEYVEDPDSEAFIDDTQRQMLLQSVYETITDPKDKVTLELYHACFDNGTTVEDEHKRKLRKYQNLGLRTPASVRQRMSRIPQKYPELSNLNPYR